MIFNELKLLDFCIDHGEHELNLAPAAYRGKAKPVVLLGAMNGGLLVDTETLIKQLRLHLTTIANR